MGKCFVDFRVPSICHGKQTDDIFTIDREKGNQGQIRGHRELAGQKSAGFFGSCKSFLLRTVLSNIIMETDRN